MKQLLIVGVALGATACGSVPVSEAPPGSAGSDVTASGSEGSIPTVEPVFGIVDAGAAPYWGSGPHMAAFCADAIATAQSSRAQLQAGGLSDSDVLAAFNTMNLALDRADGLASLMFSVNPVAAVRDAAQKCQQDLSEFSTDVGLDRALFDALAAVKTEGLDALAKRVVSHGLRDFRRSGVDKDAATRERLAAINARSVELGQTFRKNVDEDTRSIAIDDPALIADMPADWLASHAPNKDGKIIVTTNYPDFYPFQRYVADDGLRRELYTQFSTRGFPQNQPLLEELLKLRREYANLVGYSDWAEYATADKMTGSAEVVEAFIKQINAIVRPRADRDLKALLTRKRRDQPKATAIETHDRFFYVNKVRSEQYDFDAKSVRPYFSYNAVKQGILGLYAELFNVTFKQVEGAVAWHESVEHWEMFSGGELVGRFWLDMHSRENKYKHAAMFPVQTGLANARIPYASLVCNFPDPSVGDGKALMEHQQVQTFFHEFGHLIHHLLARKGTWVDLAGINVEWDFVEAPSQILEEWSWDVNVLQRFAKHVDTGEPIPAALVARMKAAEEFGKGLHLQRQIFYTAYSFFLHRADPTALDLDAITNDIYAEYSPFPRLEGSRIYANFGHLIGYSALYYTYQWSLAIAKDMYTRFETEGLLNKQTAMDYRRLILEPGGTADAADLVRDFLGRERNLDAYEAWIQKK